MVKCLAIVAGIIITAIVIVVAKNETTFCGVQCRQHHLNSFLCRGKSSLVSMENNAGCESFSVEGCFCNSGLSKGGPRKRRSLGEKNDSTEDTLSSVFERNITQIQSNITEESNPMTTNTSDKVNSKSARCNVSEQKKYSPLNMTEPGIIDINSISVDFMERGSGWLANITWNPPKENSSALTDYLVMWNSRESQSMFINCRTVPKNMTFSVLSEQDEWNYPSDLSIAVVSRPRHNMFRKTRDLKNFSPITIPTFIPVFPKRVKKKVNSKPLPYWAIIVGVMAGVMVIVLLVFLFHRRSRPQVPFVIGRSIINNTEIKPLNIDTYFASYLPESEKYSNEVATIACKLGLMGYKVVFDQVDSVRMNDIGFNMWVDKQILEAKKYIVFCSPGYVRLWQSLATSAADSKLSHVNKEDLVRVRYEIKRISDVYSENCSTSRIVCIKTDSKMSTKFLPPWMNHNMLLWPEQKEDIIRRLNDQAPMVMLV